MLAVIPGMAGLLISGPSHHRHSVRTRPAAQRRLAWASARYQHNAAVVFDGPAIVLRVVKKLFAIDDLCPDTHEEAQAVAR